jgi:ABC-type uncharacterized transport system auxiliary subunit
MCKLDAKLSPVKESHSETILLQRKNSAGNKKESSGMTGRGCFLLFAVCSLLFSCGGVPETFYYTLAFDNGPTQNDGHSPLPFTLGVEKFQSDVIYDDDRIIYRDSPYEVKYYFYRRWAAPPRHLVTDKIVGYLSESGLFEKVTTYPTAGEVKYVLNGRLLAFEEWDEESKWYGKVAIKASLYEPATQRVVWSGKFESMHPVSKKIPAAVVEALSLSVKKCLEEMTQSIMQEVGVKKGTQ